jgi:DNA-binding HxlR family transcriptional regulator
MSRCSVARTREYQHFCPVARSLEVIGEKWSLLVIRDLLRGPRRFSDLMRYLGGITPKWLTLRLRDLEAAGLVERDSAPGRREVWYRLTPAGQELAPVVESLARWGLAHAMRPPSAGEIINPEQVTAAWAVLLNGQQERPERPTVWVLRFPDGQENVLRFTGTRWSTRRDEQPDVVVALTPEAWATLLATPAAERAPLLHQLSITGAPERVQELMRLLGAA